MGSLAAVTELEYEKNKERNVRWRQVSGIDATFRCEDQGSGVVQFASRLFATMSKGWENALEIAREVHRIGIPAGGIVFIVYPPYLISGVTQRQMQNKPSFGNLVLLNVTISLAMYPWIYAHAGHVGKKLGSCAWQAGQS